MEKDCSKKNESISPETARACGFEDNVKNPKSWDEMPPVVFSQGKPLSTEALKEKYQKLHAVLTFIAKQPEWAGGYAIKLARKTLDELECRYRVSYQYLTPGNAGPSKGSTEIEGEKKPKKGDHIRAPFGSAVITRVSRIKLSGK